MREVPVEDLGFRQSDEDFFGTFKDSRVWGIRLSDEPCLSNEALLVDKLAPADKLIGVTTSEGHDRLNVKEAIQLKVLAFGNWNSSDHVPELSHLGGGALSLVCLPSEEPTAPVS